MLVNIQYMEYIINEKNYLQVLERVIFEHHVKNVRLVPEGSLKFDDIVSSFETAI